PDPLANQRRYYVDLGGNANDLRKLRSWLSEQQQFRRKYPYENLVFHHKITFAVRGRHAQPLEAMLQLAERAEESGFLHVLEVGHSRHAYNDVEVGEKWLAETPRACLGVRVSEVSVDPALLPGDRRGRSVRTEVARFYRPLLDLAVRRKVFAELLMKRNFWIN